MPESHPARKSPILPVIVALAAAVALIAALAGAFSGEDEADGSVESSTDSQQSSTSGDSLARRQADDPMAKGDVDAPVVLIAYSDFQCPFCGKWARDTAPALEEKYVADGTLRIEWRDFPYLGSESTTAALAGRAAGAQGAFWEFHDAMYADQLPPNSGNLDQKYVEVVAEELGLDVQQFRADMKSQATAEQVDADFQEGQALGITGTPSFLINGVPVIGAQPTQVFEDIIEEAAAG
ncbi:MAG: DsbA family protein [Actinobacteria bacterium]|jgi:protein-disulfide isomerase|uniref:Protein-disulfide isomerase n=1 Tax=Nocardioides marinisabuli TaxID=419476 RepID=A0A7Y9JRM5_9ACTN|nr:DsbA family protein [Nocardioides marinisabuli]MBU2073762.1 DsbA family protein [Actinomycetota bacterium]MBU2112099.1 DsbA family protein [Actinomycetota bacterium]NYD58645.1 protein-disulfide isomerase [Nocardioides marinisabuli]